MSFFHRFTVAIFEQTKAMNIKLDLPTTWNELSPVQLSNIAYQLHCHQLIVKDDAQAEMEASAKLYLQVAKEVMRGNPWRTVKVVLKQMRPKAFQPFTKFIYKRVERTKFLDKIKIKGVVYYPPAQRLRNITVAEFAYVDAAWYNWRSTGNQIWLNVLCAALYREASAQFNELDNRRPFIKQAVDARADIFSALPLKTQLAIDFTYEGCRNHIADVNPVIFPKPVEEDNAPKRKKRKYVSFGKIIVDKLHGDPSKFNETNNVLVYDFLNILTSEINRIKKEQLK